MYTSKVFTWLAAGVLGVGSSAAIAQYEPEPPQEQEQEQTFEELTVQEPQAAGESESQQLRQQLEQTLEQAYQQQGLDQAQARQHARELADQVDQHREDIQQQIQQTLQDQAQLDEQQARDASQRISQQVAEDLAQFSPEQLQAPAGVDDQQQPMGQPDAPIEQNVQEPAEAEEPGLVDPAQQEEAEQQTLEGTVIEAPRYLIHGEQAARDAEDQQQFGQQQQPLVLLTEEGEAYLILERPMSEQAPLEAEPAQPIHQDQQQFQQEQQQQFQQGQQGQQDAQAQAEEVEQPRRFAPVRDRVAPRADSGVRQRVMERERELRQQEGTAGVQDESRSDQLQQPAGVQDQPRQQRWERHPGEWRADEEPGLVDEQMYGETEGESTQRPEAAPGQEPELVEPEQARERGVYQQLEVGQQFSLTGEVHERGGLRGIVVDEYGIERSQQQQGQQPQD
ncbi:MAG: hypothetical protein WDZ31_11285 [Phycisphaeraceae bacterium]